MRSNRSVLVLLAMAGIMIASSCVKKYTCQCVVKYSGSPGLPDSSIHEFDIHDTKKAAESVCKDESYDHSEPNGIKTTETCKLY